MNYEFCSHVSLLAGAITITSGPVLELGAGYGSTPLLHGLCGSLKRSLTTIESNKEWALKFLNYGRTWHNFRQVVDFIDLPEYSQKWGLVFVDHGISEQRGHSVEKLKNADMLVVHDTCFHFLYHYEPTLSEFKYRWDWKLDNRDGQEYFPQTTVVSNIIDVAKKFAEMCL
jgi:hypothetical protein